MILSITLIWISISSVTRTAYEPSSILTVGQQTGRVDLEFTVSSTEAELFYSYRVTPRLPGDQTQVTITNTENRGLELSSVEL